MTRLARREAILAKWLCWGCLGRGMPDVLVVTVGGTWSEEGRALEGELQEDSALLGPRLPATGAGPAWRRGEWEGSHTVQGALVQIRRRTTQ